MISEKMTSQTKNLPCFEMFSLLLFFERFRLSRDGNSFFSLLNSFECVIIMWVSFFYRMSIFDFE